MSDILQEYLLQIIGAIATFIGGFLAYVLTQAKNKLKEAIDDKEMHDIIDNVVRYVEQSYKDAKKKPSSIEKKELAKEKALAWLNDKGISISETELDILIEASVSGLQQGFKNGKAE